MMIELDLSNVLNNDDYIVKKYCGLYIIKYKKDLLNESNIKTMGLYRSVITDGENILSFAPPKSINYNSFIENNDFQDCNISEFVDGTMINLFYNTKNVNKNGKSQPKWEIATKSNIGADCRFNLDVKKTFRDMFFDACVSDTCDADEFYRNLNKQYCYSFVLQHPENRIVKNIEKPQLYLTNVFHCYKNTVENINIYCKLENGEFYISQHINYPRTIQNIFNNVNSWEYINLLCSGNQIDHNFKGFVIYNNSNQRTKILNIEYEKIKRLKVNSPKLQYQFLELYKSNKLNEYLKYFPEHKEIFKIFQEKFYSWTETIYNLYIDCFIEKKKYLKECLYEYKNIKELSF